MTNYFYQLDIDYLEKELKNGKYLLVLSRKDSNIELHIIQSSRLVVKTIGNSISHCLKRANAFLRNPSTSTMPIIIEYVSTALDNVIMTSDFFIHIDNSNYPVFTATLYNSSNKNVFFTTGFSLSDVLVELESKIWHMDK